MKVSVRCVFDRLYQENWLEQVTTTTKKGQSNWPRFARNNTRYREHKFVMKSHGSASDSVGALLSST